MKQSRRESKPLPLKIEGRGSWDAVGIFLCIFVSFRINKYITKSTKNPENTRILNGFFIVVGNRDSGNEYQKRVVICVYLCVFICAGYCLNKRCDRAYQNVQQCNVRKCKKLPDFFVYHFLSNFNKGYLKTKNLLQLNILGARRSTGYWMSGAGRI